MRAETADLRGLPKPVLDDKPEWLELYDFAWRTAARHVRVSRGRAHMDAAWHPTLNYQWVWDTCFMTLYCRFGNSVLPGIQSLDNFYELQRADGYIGMTYDLDTGVEPWPNRINPPLFAWAEWEYAQATGDLSRLPRAAAAIERLMDWIDRNRRNAPHRRLAARHDEAGETGADGEVYSLYYFEDGGSSGMDDSPRSPRVAEAGQFMDWIDLSSQMALSFRMLGRMHAAMGDAARAAVWERRAVELGKTINEELWCDRTAFYHDRTIPRNFVASKTIAGFWPVLAGICPPDRLDRLESHLRNPDTFGRLIPVPTLAADDCNYDPHGTYWVGGVWAPANYMIARGLMRAGRGAAAHDLARRYLDGLAGTFARFEPHTLWECNAPDYYEPGYTAYEHRRVKPDFVGWSGLGPVAMLIENILGLDLDAVSRTIVWDIRLPGRHGLRDLAFGGGRVDLLAEPAAGGGLSVTVRGDGSFTLRVRRGDAGAELHFKGGETTIRI